MEQIATNTSLGNSGLGVKVQFLGANDGIVTGSRTLVTINRGETTRRILVDYGLFQGENESLNADIEYDVDPSTIDAVLVTHAHLDHCGGLPLLFKTRNGHLPYEGKIYGSTETLKQAAHILRDAAIVNERAVHISSREVEHFARVLDRDINKATKELKSMTSEKEEPPKSAKKIPDSMRDIEALHDAKETLIDTLTEALYTIDDAETAIAHFKMLDIPQNLEEPLEISLFPGIEARFIPSSHINGATMIELMATFAGERYTIVFTGDIGKEETVLYRKFDYPVCEDANAIVLESLHGTDEPLETLDESLRKLEKIIKDGLKAKRPIIIPVFALDRTAAFVKIINDLMDKGIWIKAYIDSPLGEKELKAYIASLNTNKSAWFDYDFEKSPLRTERFKIVKSYQDHITLTKTDEPCVVLTSSCMGYGGRVVDYFNNQIQNGRAIFVFPGYLTEDCPSRKLLDTEKGQFLEIGDYKFIKQCETIQLHGFSGHGYFEDKLRILSRYPNIETIFLNHGEARMIDDLKEKLYIYSLAEAIVPSYKEEFILA